MRGQGLRWTWCRSMQQASRGRRRWSSRRTRPSCCWCGSGRRGARRAARSTRARASLTRLRARCRRRWAWLSTVSGMASASSVATSRRRHVTASSTITLPASQCVPRRTTSRSMARRSTRRTGSRGNRSSRSGSQTAAQRRRRCPLRTSARSSATPASRPKRMSCCTTCCSGWRLGSTTAATASS